MARIHILANTPSDDSTLSGGSWALPLTNMLNQQPTKVARSTSDAGTSTRFVANLGGPKSISMFAFVANNMTGDASIRLRVSASPLGTSPTIDVTLDAFDTNVVFGSEPWGVFPWSGYREDDQPGGPITLYKHPTSELGQYVLVDIDDTANPDGYVQIGRFLAGDPFVPTYNFALGAQLAFVDESRQSRSQGGQLYSDVKPKRRRFSCDFDFMSKAEAYGAAYDLQRRLGITGNLLMVYDPDDGADVRLRRTIYGTMTALNPIVTANNTDHPYTWQFSMEEML